MRFLIAVLSGTAMLLSGCSEAEHSKAASTAGILSGAPVCSTCDIRVADRLIVGSRADSVGLSRMNSVALGRDGSVYVVSPTLPTPGALVYDRLGQFRSVLGQEGGGPGELDMAWRLTTSPAGEVFIQDRDGSIQVFGPGGAFRRSIRGVPTPRLDLVSLGDSLLASVDPNSGYSEAPYQPVQLYDAQSGDFVRGLGPRVDSAAAELSTIERARPSEEGTGLWIIGPGDRMSMWSTDGRLQKSLQWDAGWLTHIDQRYAGIDAIEVEFFGQDLWEDSETGFLWIVRTLADPPGSDPYPPVEPGTPLIGDDYSPARIAGLTVDVLTVLDPDSGEILLHHRLDQSATAEQFLSDGRLVRTGEDEDGHVWLEILRLDLLR